MATEREMGVREEVGGVDATNMYYAWHSGIQQRMFKRNMYYWPLGGLTEHAPCLSFRERS